MRNRNVNFTNGPENDPTTTKPLAKMKISTICPNVNSINGLANDPITNDVSTLGPVNASRPLSATITKRRSVIQKRNANSTLGLESDPKSIKMRNRIRKRGNSTPGQVNEATTSNRTRPKKESSTLGPESDRLIKTNIKNRPINENSTPGPASDRIAIKRKNRQKNENSTLGLGKGPRMITKIRQKRENSTPGLENDQPIKTNIKRRPINVSFTLGLVVVDPKIG